jgi:hypothetical protein
MCVQACVRADARIGGLSARTLADILLRAVASDLKRVVHHLVDIP